MFVFGRMISSPTTRWVFYDCVGEDIIFPFYVRFDDRKFDWRKIQLRSLLLWEKGDRPGFPETNGMSFGGSRSGVPRNEWNEFWGFS